MKPILATPLQLGHRLSQGLAGLWLFNDYPVTTARNYINGPSDGVIAGSPTVVPGKFGDALNFNGTTDYITVHTGRFPFTQLTPFSGYAWIRTSAAGGQTILSNWKILTNPGWEFNINVGGVGRIEMFITNQNGTGIRRGRSDALSLNDGEWHQVGFTYNGIAAASGIQLYVDGQPANTTVITDANPGNAVDGSFEIGGRDYAPSRQLFNGDIDHAGAWGSELSGYDFASLFGVNQFPMYDEEDIPLIVGANPSAPAPAAGGGAMMFGSDF